MKPASKDNNANDAYRNQFTGRKGAPLPGCDCVVCFGYCIVDQDAVLRDRAGQRALPKDMILPVDIQFRRSEEQ
jgi:hypothetical protein